MKKQNDPNKTEYYTMYDEKMPTHQRIQDAVKDASGDCWWIEQYLRSTMTKRKL